jgi:RimJ/RimL family protein N-acetyltransferase
MRSASCAARFRAPEHSFAIAVDDAVVGAIGMGVNSQATGDDRVLGRRLARGKGVCTVALRTLAVGRSTSSSSSARADHRPDNLGSQRVAEKVGFQREGVMRAHLLHPDGRLRDSVMFSLLPGELRD